MTLLRALERTGVPCHDPRLSDPEEHLLGQGSFLHGGRWNAIGSFRAVYGSTEDTVAVAESRATADYAGVAWPFRTPRLLVAIELSLQAVLDLYEHFDPRQKLGLTRGRAARGRLAKDTGARCRELYAGDRKGGFVNGGEGLLVPSARVPAGVNVVYFPENQRKSSRVTVLESEKLDRIRLA